MQLPHLIQRLRAAQSEFPVASIAMHPNDINALRASIGFDVESFCAPEKGPDTIVRVAGDDRAPSLRINGCEVVERGSLPVGFIEFVRVAVEAPATAPEIAPPAPAETVEAPAAVAESDAVA